MQSEFGEMLNHCALTCLNTLLLVHDAKIYNKSELKAMFVRQSDFSMVGDSAYGISRYGCNAYPSDLTLILLYFRRMLRPFKDPELDPDVRGTLRPRQKEFNYKLNSFRYFYCRSLNYFGVFNQLMVSNGFRLLYFNADRRKFQASSSTE